MSALCNHEPQILTNKGCYFLTVFQHLPVLKDVVQCYEEYHEKNEGFQFRHGIVVDTLPSLSKWISKLEANF